jgi:hypothetical protein
MAGEVQHAVAGERRQRVSAASTFSGVALGPSEVFEAAKLPFAASGSACAW